MAFIRDFEGNVNCKIRVYPRMCRIIYVPILSPVSFGIKPFQADKGLGMI